MNGRSHAAPGVTYLFTGGDPTLDIARRRARIEDDVQTRSIQVEDNGCGTQRVCSRDQPDRTPCDLSHDTLRSVCCAPRNFAPEVSDNGQILLPRRRSGGGSRAVQAAGFRRADIEADPRFTFSSFFCARVA